MSADDNLNSLLNTKNVDVDDEEDEDDDDYNPSKEEPNSGMSFFYSRCFVVDSSFSQIDEDSNDEDFDCEDKYSSDKNNSTTSVTANDNLVKIDENKIDSLWEKFCEDVSKKPVPVEHKLDKKVVEKAYDFAGETVIIKEEVDVDSKKSSNNSTETKPVIKATTEESNKPNTSGRVPIKRTAGGLSSLLGQLKKPKMSTLTKSLHDWNKFKESQNLDEELSQNLRSKNSYLERQAFLTRTDLREFENEKAIRDHDRKVRNMKSN